MRFALSCTSREATRIVPLDTSTALGWRGAGHVALRRAQTSSAYAPGTAHITSANATSQLFFVMRGSGTTRLADAAGGGTMAAVPGDLEIPGGRAICLRCRPVAGNAHRGGRCGPRTWCTTSRCCGISREAVRQQFPPTLYRHEAMREALDAVVRDPPRARANRLSILLGHRLFPQTKMLTHVLWAMFGILPVDAVQPPHRHQSVAVDLVVDAEPGCYTMVGKTLARDGSIKDGERFDWKPHSVFITPPGLWHSHHNESGHPAHVLPIQDAGLHTFLRTLNILFTRPIAGGACEIVETAG